MRSALKRHKRKENAVFYYVDYKDKENTLTLERAAPKWAALDCPIIYFRDDNGVSHRLLFGNAQVWGLLLGDYFKSPSPLLRDTTAMVERFLYLNRDPKCGFLLKRSYRHANKETLNNVCIPYVKTGSYISAEEAMRTCREARGADKLDFLEDYLRTLGVPNLWTAVYSAMNREGYHHYVGAEDKPLRIFPLISRGRSDNIRVRRDLYSQWAQGGFTVSIEELEERFEIKIDW